MKCALAWHRTGANSGEGPRDPHGDVVDRRVQRSLHLRRLAVAKPREDLKFHFRPAALASKSGGASDSAMLSGSPERREDHDIKFKTPKFDATETVSLIIPDRQIIDVTSVYHLRERESPSCRSGEDIRLPGYRRGKVTGGEL